MAVRTVTVRVLAALWVYMGQSGTAETAGCDNGKLFLDRDLPMASGSEDCGLPTWTETTQRLPSIETVYNPEPARKICMDEPISYNHAIPSSGAFRPVGAQSGEYVYCPPQRWLNNLYHGAAVLLYHPCAQPRERRLLSGLAHSCLPDYILTPHPQLSRLRPIAVVSWGRTLELMSAASLDVCEWLETTNSRREESDGGTQKYDLLLIGPAASHRQQLKTKGSLKECCVQTISSLLRGAPRVNVRKTRTAIRKRRESDSNTSGKADQNPTNKTLQDSRGGSSSLGSSADSLLALSSSRRGLDSEDIKQTSMRVTPPANSSGLGSFRMAKMEAQKLARSDGSAGKHSADSEQRPNAAILKIMEAAKHKAQKKKLGGPANVNEVKEREVGDKQRLSTTLPHHRSETIRVESVSKSQKHPNLQQVDDSNCGVCEEGKPCASGKRPAAGNRGSPRTPRTDEAVWAAGALGFLLILLTLSVLHTRLYRHWRTTPSLYWHDPQRDYDSVADVIRRRLRNGKVRRKRGRRQECVLLPSSSSSDEDP
ncbi:tumor protein p53-inducible protein 13 [Oryzias melastigma]|uniref:tumor protein p53-inducible protein 13 n=1 Tax=Oryzias melastigma TaxID=30732 RepID=UPI000CF7D2F6|nr:tumor protein p53-inducible protein 13 [Oryzias melastigma]